MKYLKELALARFAAKKAGTSLKLKMAEEIVTLSEDDHDIKVQAALDSEVIILEILRESDFPILAVVDISADQYLRDTTQKTRSLSFKASRF